MKKERIKGLVMGLILGLTLSATVVMAAPQVAELVFGVRVSLDGQMINFEEDMRPFVIGGRTFLPVRAIADAVGLDVGFDDATNTVLLTSGGQPPAPPAPPEQPPTPPPAAESVPLLSIARLRPGSANVSGSGWTGHNNAGMNLTLGERLFPNSLSSGGTGNQEVTFNLNGEFTQLSGYLGSTTTSNRNNNFRLITIRIFGDGDLLHETTVLDLDDFEAFSVDVTGVQTLVINRVHTGSGLFTQMAILNPQIR